jgi:hypothetical protein
LEATLIPKLKLGENERKPICTKHQAPSTKHQAPSTKHKAPHLTSLATTDRRN